ncbi:uncharacterized protein [Diadema setosum]|uniref:uncharacterized protein n=1 Tax=Diadema setosum TaxID=31175 RepID=UPI003B3BC296
MGGGGSKQKSQGAVGHSLRRDEYYMLQHCLYSLPFPPGTINAEVVAAASKITERIEYKDPITLLSKGERAKGIYILVKGHLSVLSSSRDLVAELGPGSFVGEVSTLFYQPVTATVQSTTPSQLLLLKEGTLRRAIGEVVSTDLMDYFVRRRYFDTSGMLDQGDLLHRIALDTLSKLPLFSKWNTSALTSLVKQCKEDAGIPHPVLLIPNNSVLATEGEKTEEVVIVTRGKVEVRLEKEVIATLDPERWPVWIGEEGLFVNADNLCAVCASGTCQAVRLQKSTTQSITNKYKAEAGLAFEKLAKVWQKRLSQQEQFPDRMKAELLLPVLLNTLSQVEMFSEASLLYLYDMAVLARANLHADNDVIVDGSGNVAKVKRALQARETKASQRKKQPVSQEPALRRIQGEEAASVLAETDIFLLPLRGEIAVGGVDNFIFPERSLIYLPEAQLKEVRLVAKGATLVLTIEGRRLLNLCNVYSDVHLNVPRPLL